MKRVIAFHKAYLPTFIVSMLLIILGLAGIWIKGVNLGVDFQAGINQSIQLAYPAAEITYEGSGTPVLSISDTIMRVVFAGAEQESRTIEWNLKTAGTLSDLARDMKLEGLNMSIKDGAGLSADLLVPTFQGDYSLAKKPVLVYRHAKGSQEVFGSIEEVRAALKEVGSISVQKLGASDSMQYMIRVRDDGSDKAFSEKIPQAIDDALESVFGQNSVVVISTDYVGASFSQDLAKGAWKMTLFTVLAILAYATLRFKLQYALGAVLAIMHDGLIMLGFIIWTGMEFNTTSIAAILTILGYSLNDTIVIFDRIREERKIDQGAKLLFLIDKSITDTLGRTFITSLTTLLAVLALYFFTSGSIKDFALALVVGIITGTYSSIFLASGFVYLWEKVFGNKGSQKTKGSPAAIVKT